MLPLQKIIAHTSLQYLFLLFQDNIVDHFSSSHKIMDQGEASDNENESNKKWLMIIKHLIQTNPSRAAVLAVFIFGLSITWLST